MKILIYGSTYLTQKVCEELLKYKEYNLIFTEDDILVGGIDNYVNILINNYTEKNAGFIGLIGVEPQGRYPTHCHGGVGLVKTKILEQVYDSNPFSYEGFDRALSVSHEIVFTNNIVKKTGLKLVHLGVDSWNLKQNYCINYDNYKKCT